MKAKIGLSFGAAWAGWANFHRKKSKGF
jgi:hypothetical protein